MHRMPTCIYLSQSEAPDTHGGVAKWACSMFKWEKVSFTLNSNDVITKYNDDIFLECQHCMYNTEYV